MDDGEIDIQDKHFQNGRDSVRMGIEDPPVPPRPLNRSQYGGPVTVTTLEFGAILDPARATGGPRPAARRSAGHRLESTRRLHAVLAVSVAQRPPFGRVDGIRAITAVSARGGCCGHARDWLWTRATRPGRAWHAGCGSSSVTTTKHRSSSSPGARGGESIRSRSIFDPPSRLAQSA